MDDLCRHIDRICELTGGFDNVAIGSDLDGYIKPALPGLEHMGQMARLQEALVDRYGEDRRREVVQRQRAPGTARGLGAQAPSGRTTTRPNRPGG